MSQVLLDTNIVVFMLTNRLDEISRDVNLILKDYNTSLAISTISVMEIIQLCRTGKIKLKKGLKSEDVPLYIENEFFITIRSFSKTHTSTMATLHISNDHNDPFDHAIISHAITDRYTLVSSDSRFKHYENQHLSFVYNKR